MDKILIPDWRDAWKWLSMWGAAILVAWSTLPAEQQNAILQLFGINASTLTALMGLAIMVGRVIKQGKDAGSASDQ